MEPDGNVKLLSNDMDLCGDIIQTLCDYLALDDLGSAADFPSEINKLVRFSSFTVFTNLAELFQHLTYFSVNHKFYAKGSSKVNDYQRARFDNICFCSRRASCPAPRSSRASVNG